MLQQYRYYKTSGLSETKKKILFENGHGHAGSGSGTEEARAHVHECSEACVTAESLHGCEDTTKSVPRETAGAGHVLDTVPDITSRAHVAALNSKAEESQEQHSKAAHNSHCNEEIKAAAHASDLAGASAGQIPEGITTSPSGVHADGGRVGQKGAADDVPAKPDALHDIVREERTAAAAASLETCGHVAPWSAESATPKFPAISEACSQMLSSTSSLHRSAEHIGAAIKDAVLQASAAAGSNPHKLVLQYRKASPILLSNVPSKPCGVI
jgi:hypothetical protein